MQSLASIRNPYLVYRTDHKRGFAIISTVPNGFANSQQTGELQLNKQIVIASSLKLDQFNSVQLLPPQPVFFIQQVDNDRLMGMTE